MISRHLLRSLVLIVLLSSATFAQTPATSPSPQTDEQRKAQQELQAKALNLLEDVIKDSESFKHAENRIRLKAASANVLWSHDETRARTLFKEAIASFVALLKNQDSDDASANPRMFGASGSLRREFLQMLAQRDARMAREFLRATRQQEGQTASTREALIDQPLEIHLARQIAATDPKQALEIAEESLSGGFSYELPQLISDLRQKDPEGASKLASQVVTKLRTENLESNHMARQTAMSLLREATQTTTENEGQGVKAAPPLLDQATTRELIEIMAAEALRPSSTSTDLLAALQEMLAAVEKYAPTRAAQVRRKMEQKGAVADKTTDEEEAELEAMNAVLSRNRYTAVFENGSAEELLAEAAKAPEELREMLYRQAAAKMMEEGDIDRARQLINERVKDPGERKQILSSMEEMASFKAIEQGKIEQGRKLLATLRTNEERVMLLAQLALSASLKGDKKIALQLLDEARELLPGRAKNFTQLGAQVSVARAYAPLDAARSLAILEPVVDQLNELLAAAVVLGAFITEEIIKDDEIMMEPLNMISNEVFVNYLGDVNALANADFERTKALADRFLRDEIRIAARLLIAQSILSPKPKGMPGVPTLRRTATRID
jgi:hypothetical protein